MGQSEGHHAYISCKGKTWGNMKQEVVSVKWQLIFIELVKFIS
jgi:hypothetical protein